MGHAAVDDVGPSHAVVDGIEARFDHVPPAHDLPRVKLRTRKSTPLWEVAQTLFKRHRQRTYVGLCLMAAQAFFYNAIFFTYALVLTRYYGVGADRVGLYILPFALGNFLGPLLLGPLSDRFGRRHFLIGYEVSQLVVAAIAFLTAQPLPLTAAAVIGGAGSPGLIALAGVLALAVFGVVGWLVVRRRRGVAGPSAPLAGWTDAACPAAWAENRRRFFDLAPSPKKASQP